MMQLFSFPFQWNRSLKKIINKEIVLCRVYQGSDMKFDCKMADRVTYMYAGTKSPCCCNFPLLSLFFLFPMFC